MTYIPYPAIYEAKCRLDLRICIVNEPPAWKVKLRRWLHLKPPVRRCRHGRVMDAKNNDVCSDRTIRLPEKANYE